MTEEMRLIVVCQESPWPARHGGTVDMLRRLQALHAAGVRVFLITWSESPSDSEAISALQSVAERVVVLPYWRGFWQRLLLLPKFFQYPGPVCTRWISKSGLKKMLGDVLGFGSDFILQDGLMAGGLARELAREGQLGLLVRSHNIEHRYWAHQAKRASGLNWLKIKLRQVGLARFERDGLRQAVRFFDISADDLLFWERLGLGNGSWLPPIVSVDTNDAVAKRLSPVFDVGFVGNLRMPNNVEGVRWLIQEVIPVVSAKLGRQVRLLVAGSAPSREVLDLVEGTPGVELLANFERLDEVLMSAKVLVNPMLAGSGVALKTVDMLLSGRPVVSTSQGVSGLPDELKGLVVVRDSIDTYAQALLEAISVDELPEQGVLRRNRVASMFGTDSIAPLLEMLKGRPK